MKQVQKEEVANEWINKQTNERRKEEKESAQSLRLNVLVSTRYLSDRDNKNIIDLHSLNSVGKRKFIQVNEQSTRWTKSEGGKNLNDEVSD